MALDLVGQSSKRKGLADAAYYNLLLAAISTIPVLATGILSWQFKFEGEKLQGILLLHVVLGTISTLMIWMVWWVNRQSRQRTEALPRYRLAVEFLARCDCGADGSCGRPAERCDRLDVAIGIGLESESCGFGTT